MSQIVVPAASRSVITPVQQTTFQVGTYASLTDTFTKVVDLNDHQSFWLVKVDLPQPEKVYARSSTIRVAGERITNWNYKNRHITLTLQLLYQSGTTALLAAVRSLLAAIENPPYRLAFAPPNASVLTYADVVAVSHTIPSDGKVILAKALSNITINFECAPGFSGDRVTLSNLVVNPGFEAGSGPSVQVFNDSFANANAYTLGGSTIFSGGVLTLTSGATARFGSPEWGPLNSWAIRFEWFTGTSPTFFLHRDALGNNYTQVVLNGATLVFNQNVAGSFHTLSTTSGATLANATWYWLVITQFPAAPGTPPDLAATLYADSAGSVGAQIVASGAVVCVDATAGLSGLPLIFASGGSLNIGGVAGGNTVSLFGPGGWGFAPTNGTTGAASGAWEQSTSNTYTGGAVTSFGAGRVDVPPSGTLDAFWTTYTGGAPAGTAAIPAAPSQTFGLSAWVRSSGVGAGCAQNLLALEYDASGAFLRYGVVATTSGPQAAWTQLGGTYTTGASCAWLGIRLEASDGVAGASAGGVIWWDNVQCWNETTTGQTVMPYCELRFPQSPAQLLLTGLQGDMVAPAYVAWGTFLSSWGLGASLNYALGRRAQASANAQLVGVSHGFYGVGVSPQATAVLDSASYGGFYPTVTMNPSWNPRAFSFAPQDALGVYHLFSRSWTNQSLGNIGNVETRVITQQRSQAWWGQTNQSDQLGAYAGPFVNPISASSTWTAADSGQANVPPFPMGALVDLSQNYLTPRPQWADTTGGGSTSRVNWQLLLPVDGAVLVGQMLNPSNAPFAVTNEWLFAYLDGLLLNQLSLLNGELTDEGATYSLETAPLPNPGHSAGGPGTSGTAAICVNNAGDAYLTVDPNATVTAVSGTTTAAGGTGVNQLAGYLADNAGAVLPLYAEIAYTPLYLYPRGQ